MYGLIAKLTLLPGKREEATALIAESSANMPGCFSYVIANDAADENILGSLRYGKAKPVTTPRCPSAPCRPSFPK